MTHPAKYAPPGWTDPGPYEREVVRLVADIATMTSNIQQLKSDMIAARRQDAYQFRPRIKEFTKRLGAVERAWRRAIVALDEVNVRNGKLP